MKGVVVHGVIAGSNRNLRRLADLMARHEQEVRDGERKAEKEKEEQEAQDTQLSPDGASAQHGEIECGTQCTKSKAQRGRQEKAS